jgi:hypothetical protein
MKFTMEDEYHLKELRPECLSRRRGVCSRFIRVIQTASSAHPTELGDRSLRQF